MFQNGPRNSFLFKNVKANRSRDDCCGEEFVMVPKVCAWEHGIPHATKGCTGEHQGWSGGRRSKGKVWGFFVFFFFKLLLWFFLGKNGQGWMSSWAGLKLMTLINFGRLWDPEMVSSCPVSGPGVI